MKDFQIKRGGSNDLQATVQPRAGEGVLSLREGQISARARRPQENRGKVEDVIREGVNRRDWSSETAWELNLKEGMKRDSHCGFLAMRLPAELWREMSVSSGEDPGQKPVRAPGQAENAGVTYHGYPSQTPLPSRKEQNGVWQSPPRKLISVFAISFTSLTVC